MIKLTYMKGKITFKLVYQFPNQLGRTISFARYNSDYQLYEWLDKKGVLQETAEYNDNHVKHTLVWTLSQSESIAHSTRDVGGSNGITQSVQRCFTEKSYLAREEEDRLINDDEKTSNFINRMAHQFLKGHPEVLVRDEKGENVNKALRGAGLFELIEKSYLEAKEVEKNEMAAEGAKMITDLFKGQADRFIQFCYAWGLPVKGKTKEQLYNACMTRHAFAPSAWAKVLKDSNYDLIAKFKKALEDNLIVFENACYNFNFEAIGKTEDECIAYFNLNESPRKLLYARVGFAAPSEVAEIVEAGISREGEPAFITQAEKKKVYAKVTTITRLKTIESRMPVYRDFLSENPKLRPYFMTLIAEKLPSDVELIDSDPELNPSLKQDVVEPEVPSFDETPEEE